MVAEVLLLIAYRALTGRGLPARQLMTTAMAGAGLLLAVRFALSSPVSAGPIAFGLLLALAAHLLDLRLRWGRH